MIIRCNECQTILLKIQNGCIIIVSRHHGRQHINVIPIAKLVEWGKRTEPRDPAMVSAEKKTVDLAETLEAAQGFVERRLREKSPDDQTD